ncbi:MAG: DUF1320 family protein [Opitutales bacterium]|nr:DUF1320 family protein [Opitutales bacterium]
MWTTLTVDDLSSRLTGAELKALQSAALGEDQGDPTPEIIHRAIDECRSYLAARPNGDMGSEGTLPPQVHGPCLDIARYRLCTRLAVGGLARTLLPDARREEYKDAIALLRDIQSGKAEVEAPKVLTTESLPNSATPKIRVPKGRFIL